MKHFSIFLLALPMLIGALPAQCVLDPIQSRLIEGYLLFGFEGKYRTVDKAEVLILDQYNTHRIVARATVDKKGYFYIKGIKAGNYHLSGRSEPLSEAYVDIRIVSKKEVMKSAKESMILIVLGADGRHECGGSSITIESRSIIDGILHNLQ